MDTRFTLKPIAIPARAGIGLRAAHYQSILDTQPDIGWFEVHSENYFGDGGLPHNYLEKIRQAYPLSLHGVGLSLGSSDPLNQRHLDKLKQLILRYQPGLVSEHLSWGSIQQHYMNDLLPLPFLTDTLKHLVNRIHQVQEYLGTQILIENVSSYVQFNQSDMMEWEFITEVAKRSGCGILLDVNNVYVNACNHGFDPTTYLQYIPRHLVREIHLAGHTRKHFAEGDLLIDTHDQPVSDAVWALFNNTLPLFPATPVLIEWDSHIPDLSILINEALKAEHLMHHTSHGVHHVQPATMAN